MNSISKATSPVIVLLGGEIGMESTAALSRWRIGVKVAVRP